MNNVELSQAIVTIAQATVTASQFPGVRIQSSETDEWTYDVTTPVGDYNRYNVPLASLVVEVNAAIDELTNRFGKHGEGLGDLVLNASVNTRPA